MTTVKNAGVMGSVLSLLIAASCCLASAPASAQVSGSRLGRPVATPKDTDQTAKLPPPPAVPGSKPNDPGAAPADKANLDMPPNDALFDAINRGDTNGVKDALSRGADLDARNILGLSPLDLSVDLGRNDISFLLLSLRGADTPPTQPRSAAAPARGKAGAQARELGGREVTVRAAVPKPGTPKTAQLFAGNGGIAVPQAGFLGFGGSVAK